MAHAAGADLLAEEHEQRSAVHDGGLARLAGHDGLGDVAGIGAVEAGRLVHAVVVLGLRDAEEVAVGDAPLRLGEVVVPAVKGLVLADRGRVADSQARVVARRNGRRDGVRQRTER